jgi:hypothetical protein
MKRRLVGLDERRVAHRAGQPADVLGPVDEPGVGDREVVLLREAVEGLLVEDAVEHLARREHDVEVRGQPLPVLGDDVQVDVPAGEENALLSELGAEAHQVICQLRTLAGEAGAVDLPRVARVRPGLLEVVVDPDHRDTHPSKRPNRSEPVLAEPEHDGRGKCGSVGSRHGWPRQRRTWGWEHRPACRRCPPAARSSADGRNAR